MMKKKNRIIRKSETRRGVASLYVVIFTTLLLGVITLSFVRIIISEQNQTTNSDLSQSAYDSALAGVEDAKVALIKYHDCLNKGAKASGSTDGNDELSECNKLVKKMQTGINTESCDVVSDILNRSMKNSDTRTGEVAVQETSGDINSSSQLDQAYTCVKISEELPDYRSTLSASNRSRIVPIRVDDVDEVKSVTIRWYSKLNGTGNNITNTDGNFQTASATSAPPAIETTLIQADSSFTLDEMDDTTANGTDRGTILFYPVDGTNTTANYYADQNHVSVNANEGFKKSNDKVVNSLKNIYCNGLAAGQEFACTATVELPYPARTSSRNSGATFLYTSLPYGKPETDFAVELCKSTRCLSTSDANHIDFKGVQARVDSTGRANDLYRRVESRIELVDISFPYPEFVAQLTGSGSESGIEKNFWITNNCWRSVNGDMTKSGVCTKGDGTKINNDVATDNP